MGFNPIQKAEKRGDFAAFLKQANENRSKQAVSVRVAQNVKDKMQVLNSGVDTLLSELERGV